MSRRLQAFVLAIHPAEATGLFPVAVRATREAGPFGPPRRVQQIAGAVAVLNVGGQNTHAERVDEDVTLAPRDFLARVIALRVEPLFEV